MSHDQHCRSAKAAPLAQAANHLGEHRLAPAAKQTDETRNVPPTKPSTRRRLMSVTSVTSTAAVQTPKKSAERGSKSKVDNSRQ